MRLSCLFSAVSSLPNTVLLLPLFVLLSLPFQSLSQCSDQLVIIQKSDAVGNGWNGSDYMLYNSSATLVASGTLTTGTQENDTLCLPLDCYQIVVSEGLAPASIGWSVVHVGNVVDSGGAGETSWFELGAACVVSGCIDPDAVNFNVDATVDDGSCIYPADNDLCDDAEQIECGDEIEGNTAEATLDVVPFCGQSITAPGLWFMVEGELSIAQATVCDASDFDTRITVFRGDDCESLECVGESDDSDNCPLGASELFFPAQDGETYFILVHGFGNETGTFTFLYECEELEVPENELCEAAEVIGCGFSDQFSNFGASATVGEDCGNSNNNAGIWFELQGDGSYFTIEAAGEQWEMQTSVYSGSCDDLQCVGSSSPSFSCNNTNAPLGFQSQEDVTYFVLVQPLYGFGGAFDLTVDCADGIAVPTNLYSCDALELACGDQLESGFLGSIPANVSAAVCGPQIEGGGVWFKTTGDGKFFTLSTCASTVPGIDTRISIFESNNADCTALVCIGGNDNFCEQRAEISWPTESGVEYYMLVHGPQGLDAPITVTLNCLTDPPVLPANPFSQPNEICEHANLLKCSELQIGATEGALFESLPVSDCGSSISGSGVWYRLVEPCSEVQIQVCANIGVDVHLFSSNNDVFPCLELSCLEFTTSTDAAATLCPIEPLPPAGFTGVKAVTETALLDFVALSGETYFVYVSGRDCAQGNFVINTECSLITPPSNDDACSAISISTGNSAQFDTDCATLENEEPIGDNGASGTVWYSFTAPASGCVSLLSISESELFAANVFEADACDDFNTYNLLGSVGASQLAAGSSVGCLTPGSNYLIQIFGVVGNRGSGQLLLEDCGGVPVSVSITGCDEVFPAFAPFACSDLSALPVGGAFPVLLEWDDGSASAQREVCPTFSTTYTVTATDANGCSASSSFVVNPVDSLSLPSPLATSIPLATNGTLEACLGQDVVFASNLNDPDFELLWDFGDGFIATDHTAAHTYQLAGSFVATLTASNVCGQSKTDTLIVNVVNLPAPQIVCTALVCSGDTATYCTTDGCGNLSWTVEGGTIVSAYPDSSCIEVVWDSALGNAGAVTLNIGNCPGYCSASSTTFIDVLAPTVLISGSDTACTGNSAVYSIPKVAGSSYSWQVDFPATIVSGQGTESVEVFWPESDSLGFGTVSVDIQNPFLGCNGSGSLSVVLLPEFSISGPGQLCAGLPNTSSPFEVQAPASWSVTTPTGTLLSNVAINTASFSSYSWDAGPGLYSIKASVTTNAFCDQSAYFAVLVHAAPPAPLIAGATSICPDNVDLYDAIPNAAGVQYTWSVEGGSIVSAAQGPSAAVHWNASGPYSIDLQQQALTDPGCASVVTSLAVEPYSSLTVAGPTLLCAGNTATYTAVPAIQGQSYLWSVEPGIGHIVAGQGTATAIVEWNQPGTAAIHLLVLNCDSLHATLGNITVSQPPAPDIAVSGVLCDVAGSSVELSATTALPFEWKSPANAVLGTDSILEVSLPGVYSLVVLGGDGCTNSSDINIELHAIPEPELQVTNDDTLFCGVPVSAALTLNQFNSAAQIAWLRGTDTLHIGQWTAFNATTAGNYSALVTYSNGCTGVSNAVEIVATDAAVTITSQALVCGPDALFEASTTGVDKVIWNFGDGTSIVIDTAITSVHQEHSFAQPGQYTVELIGQSDLCTVASTQLILLPLDPEFTFSNGCQGYLIGFANQTVAIPGGSLTYSWDFGDGSPLNQQSSPSHTYAAAGSYEVVLHAFWVSGTDSCSISQSHVIEIGGPDVSIEAPTGPFCEDAEQQIVALDAHPQIGTTYSWDINGAQAGNGTALLHTFSAGGDYEVGVLAVDQLGCTDTASASITVQAVNPAIISISGTMCQTGDTVWLTSAAAAGYDWSHNNQPISSDAHAYVTGPGLVNLIVYDSAGCAASTSVEINLENQPNASVVSSPQNTHFCLGDVVPTTFAVPNYSSNSYSWFRDGVELVSEHNNSVTTTTPGIYWVEVSTSSGCVSLSDSLALEVSNATLNIELMADSSCNSFSFLASISGTNNTPIWTFGEGTSSTSGVSVNHTFPGAGIYPVVASLTDGGCVLEADTALAVPLAAQFSVGSVCFNAPATFTDLSTYLPGSSLNRTWDFGDGTIVSNAGSQTPHTYAAPGNYIATLTVSDGNCTSSFSEAILVGSANADFVVGPLDACPGSTLNLQPVEADSNLLLASWQIGNDPVLSEYAPSYFVGNEQQINIELTVVDLQGCIDSSDATVTIQPAADASLVVSGILCSNGSETAVLTAAPSLQCTWLNSSLVVIGTTNSLELTHGGSITLNYTDSSGCNGDTTLYLPELPAPISSITADTSTLVCPGEALPNVTLLATQTAGASYQWMVEGAELMGETGSTFTTNTGGNYQLITTAANGCSTLSDTMYLGNTICFLSSPVEDVGATVDRLSCNTLLFTGSATGCLDAFAWQFGDSPGSSLENPDATDLVVSHTYTEAGIYTVQFTATSDSCEIDTGSGSFIAPLLVDTAFAVVIPLAANFTATANCAGLPIQFDDASTALLGTGYSLQWDFGDGSSAAVGSSVHHSYATPGLYTVTLTAIGDTCSSTFSKDIVVEGPLANFSVSPNPACIGTPVQFDDLSTGTQSIATLSWEFDDPSSTQNTAVGTASPMHVFSGAGTYEVQLIVQDALGCADTALNSVTVVPLPVVPTMAIDGALCGIEGDSVEISVPASGLAHNWTNTYGIEVGTGPSLVTTLAGQYTLQVTDAYGCTNSETVAIDAMQAPVASISSPAAQLDFCDQPPFDIQLIALEGAGYQYSWYNNGNALGSTQSSIVVDSTGNYSVAVTSNGCTTESNTISIVGPAGSATIVLDTPWCNPIFAIADTVGAVSQLEWQFDDGTTVTDTLGTTHHFAVPGPHQLTLSYNSGGCQTEQSTNIFVPFVTGFDSIGGCAGDSLHFVNTTSFGGAIPDSIGWLWDFGDGTTSVVASPKHVYTLPGTYLVSLVGSANTCTSSISRTITVTGANVSIVVGNTPVCAANTTHFDVQAIASQPIEAWNWSFGDGETSTMPALDHTYAHAGQFEVQVTATDSSGCVARDLDTLTVLPTTHPGSVSIAGALCSNDTGGVTLTAPAATSYSWTTPDSIWLDSSESIAVSAPGQYTLLTWDSAGCAFEQTIGLQQVQAPVANILSDANQLEFCNEPVPIINLLAFNGTDYTFTWLRSDSTLQGPDSIGSLATSSAGLYSVVVAANGCTATSEPVEIMGSNELLSAQAIDLCNPVQLHATTNFTAGPVTWNFGDGTTTTLTQPTIAHQFGDTGTYVVSVQTEGSSCTLIHTDTIEVQLIANFSAALGCQGEPTAFSDLSTVISSDSILSWQWNFGDSTASHNSSTEQAPVHTFSSAGSYVVQLTVTSANCTSTYSDTIEVVPLHASFTYSQPASCAGNAIAFESSSSGANAIVSYDWNFGDAGTAQGQQVEHTFALGGNFPVTLSVEDAIGCTSDTVVFVQVQSIPAAGTIAQSSGPSCVGDTLQLTAPAGVSWAWSNGETTQAINVVESGSHYVSVTDTNGCHTVAGPLTALFTALPTVSILGDTNTCAGSQSFLSTGYTAASGTHQWFLDGAALSGATNPTLILAGTSQDVGNYSVQYTSATTGCTALSNSAHFSFSPAPAQPVLNIAGDTFCFGAPINAEVLSPNPDLFYLWSSGQVGASVTIAPPGNYTVEAFNDNGCSATSEPVAIVPRPDVSCVISGCYRVCDTVPSLIAPGPTGFAAYEWISVDSLGTVTSLGNSIDLEITSSGMYQLVLSNSAGCADTSEVLKVEFIPCDCDGSLAATVSLTSNPKCVGAEDGSIGLAISGGVPPYAVTWDHPAALGPSPTGLPAATYCATVADFNGCEIDVPICATLTDPAPVVATATSTFTDCPEAANGTITVAASGGQVPYTYSIAGGLNAQSSNSFGQLPVGQYEILAVDANGCYSLPAPISVVALDDVDPTVQCQDAVVHYTDLPLSSTMATPAVFDNCAATPLLSYSDSTVPATCGITNFRTWTAVDAFGNAASCVSTLNIVDTVAPSVLCPDTIVLAGCDSIANWTVTATDDFSTVTSSSVPASGSVFEIGTTEVLCTATDACGNSASCSFVVVRQSALTIELCSDQAVALGYFPEEQAVVSVTNVVGGTAPYSYAWSTGDTSASVQVSPTSNTVYAVTVTDANSCSAMGTHAVTVVDIHCGNSTQGDNDGNSVYMCMPSGRTRCTSINQIPRRLFEGWTLGPCDVAVDFSLTNCGEPALSGCGCDPGISSVVVQYNGSTTSDLLASKTKNGPVYQTFPQVVPGQLITVTADMVPDWKLGSNIWLRVVEDCTSTGGNNNGNGNGNGGNGGNDCSHKLHTSCSEPIYPGMEWGSFTLIQFTNSFGEVCASDTLPIAAKHIEQPTLPQPELLPAIHLDVFPNPFSDGFSVVVELETSGPFTATVTNSLGAVVYQLQSNRLSSGQFYIDLQGEADGVYFLSVEADGAVRTEKVVKL